jgi:hypothetical protein
VSIFAHPFRPGREAGRIAKKLYSRFDAVSLNARDVYFYGKKLRVQTRNFALDWDLPLVAGSDTHHYYQLGSVVNVFKRSFSSLPELKKAITKGKYSIKVHRQLRIKVKKARKNKARLKKRK